MSVCDIGRFIDPSSCSFHSRLSIIIITLQTHYTFQLWAGVPAKFVRELTAEEIAHIKTQAVDTFEVGGHALTGRV